MPYAGLTADDHFLARAREMCRRFCLEVWGYRKQVGVKNGVIELLSETEDHG